MTGAWSTCCAPSFNGWVCECVCVFVCVVLSSLSFRQTDSWSNRLKGAVGSLGGDLSPLGPLSSGQQLKVQHHFPIVFFHTALHVVSKC